METETPAPVPQSRRAPDVVVRTTDLAIIFEARTPRAQVWLTNNLPEAQGEGTTFIVRPLRGAQAALFMTMEGLEVR